MRKNQTFLHYVALTGCILLITLSTTAQSVLYQQNSEVNNLMVQYEADR
jgi:hypothetical protein